MAETGTPQDRLEELISSYLDGSAGEPEVGELTGMLRGSVDRQRILARFFMQHGTLAWILRGAGSSASLLPPTASRSRGRPWWIAIPVAASLLLTVFIVRTSQGPADSGVRTLDFQDGVFPSGAYEGTRDARMSDKDLSVNRGSDSFIEVESSGEPGGKPTLVSWDLRGIPTGSIVTSASITLGIASVSREEAYVVHALRRPWRESEVTWLEYAAGKPWAVPGGKGSEDQEPQTLARFVPTRGSFTFPLNPAGVNVVQAWVNAPDSNRGFIVLSSSDQGEFYAHSREADVRSSRPKLSVTFRPPNR